MKYRPPRHEAAHPASDDQEISGIHYYRGWRERKVLMTSSDL